MGQPSASVVGRATAFNLNPQLFATAMNSTLRMLIATALLASAPALAAVPSLLAVQQALENTTERVILPGLAEFRSRGESLAAQAGAFCRVRDGAGLEATRQVWRAAMQAWQRLTMLRFGPAKEGVPTALEWLIDSSQMPGAGRRGGEVEKAVRQFLASDLPLDADALAGQRVHGRGLPALEWLLFQEQALVQFRDRVAGERRCAYLAAAATDLAQQAAALERAWRTDGGDYVHRFLADGPEAALDTLINNVVALLETIKRNKLEAVLGQGGDKARPERAESALSGQSLDNIHANLDGVLALLDSGTSSYGLDDALAEVGQGALLDRLRAQVEALRAALNAVTPSLAQAVRDNPAAVAAALRESSRLLQLARLELVPALGVKAAFSETDGD